MNFPETDRTETQKSGMSDFLIAFYIKTINEKVTDDIRHILTANGLNGDAAEIFIVDAEDHTTEFDLDDPDNDLELFELRIEVPYSTFNSNVIELPEDMDIVASVVFRNGRTKIVQ